MMPRTADGTGYVMVMVTDHDRDALTLARQAIGYATRHGWEPMHAEPDAAVICLDRMAGDFDAAIEPDHAAPFTVEQNYGHVVYQRRYLVDGTVKERQRYAHGKRFCAWYRPETSWEPACGLDALWLVLRSQGWAYVPPERA